MKKSTSPLVYVVDDEPEFAGAIGMLLETAGHTCRIFTSPRNFLRSIQPADCGCILLDVRMPGMSGLEVQDHLARRNFRQPIVFLTGHGDIPMAVQATRAGALDFLEKPVREKTLLSRVRAALKQDARRFKNAAAQRRGRQRVDELSTRERQVGELLAQGCSSLQMADQLALSVRTVEMHRLRMMRRLGVKNTAQAVRLILEAAAAGT